METEGTTLKRGGRNWFPKTYSEIANAMPPFLVYALGLKRRARTQFTYPQILKRSGLPQRTFHRIVRSYTWNKIKLKDIEAFTRACGVNLLKQNSERQYLLHVQERKARFKHLQTRQLKKFELQCKIWALQKQMENSKP